MLITMYVKAILFVLSLLTFANANKQHDKRISGGLVAGIGQFPYQVLIQYKSFLVYHDRCGGALVKPNYVLTTARCSKDEKLRVRAGFVTKSDSGAKYMDVTVKYLHPKYNAAAFANDIALLKLENSYTLDNTIALIRLPEANSTPSGHGTLAGWGASMPRFGTQSNSLLYTSFNIITEYDCKLATDLFADLIQDSNICAQSATTNACVGDDGGSLVQDNRTIGVASWPVNECDRNGGTVVFTKVSSYISWINGTINA